MERDSSGYYESLQVNYQTFVDNYGQLETSFSLECETDSGLMVVQELKILP
jgi:hypothetical protein